MQLQQSRSQKQSVSMVQTKQQSARVPELKSACDNTSFRQEFIKTEVDEHIEPAIKLTNAEKDHRFVAGKVRMGQARGDLLL